MDKEELQLRHYNDIILEKKYLLKTCNCQIKSIVSIER